MMNGQSEAMEVAEHDQRNCVRDEDVYYPIMQYPALEPDLQSEEWCYYARRTSQEIIPGLYLGPYSSATRQARPNLLNIGITHIVCVRGACEAPLIRANHTDFISYLLLEVDDTQIQGIIPQLKLVIDFLDDCFKAGGRALVHGNAGMARSAAMVTGYVMWRHGVDAKTAFRYVQSKRFCIVVNDNFMAQLTDFEAFVRAKHDVGTPNQDNQRKRQIEDEEEDDPKRLSEEH